MSDVRSTSDGDARQLASREVFTSRVFKLYSDTVRFPNGHEGQVDMLRHPGAACILPLTEEGDVLLVRQYRYCTGGWMLEVPAGTLEGDEPVEACAYREIEEEAGVRAARLEPLGFVWTTPGFTDERIWMFLATGLTGSAQSLDDDESIAVVRVPFTRAVQMAEGGEIEDAKSICTLLRAAAFLRRAGVMG